MFLPTLATDASSKKYDGAKGVSSSMNEDTSIDIDAIMRHLLGSASNLLFTYVEWTNK